MRTMTQERSKYVLTHHGITILTCSRLASARTVSSVWESEQWISPVRSHVMIHLKVSQSMSAKRQPSGVYRTNTYSLHEEA